jgi:hypothetical protein
VTLRRSGNGVSLGPVRSQTATGADGSVLDAEAFQRMISLERKRTERSRKPFVLMLLDMGSCLPSAKSFPHSRWPPEKPM